MLLVPTVNPAVASFGTNWKMVTTIYISLRNIKLLVYKTERVKARGCVDTAESQPC